ncbi:MAG TPA: hypothetical protein VIG06_18675 [Kofleriaceae bacterium]
MRGPVVSLTLLLAGCSFELDLLGDSEPDRCPGTDLDYCVPPGVSIRVAEGFSDLDPGTDPLVALGGVVPLWVDSGGSQEEVEREVTGGEVVSEDGPALNVRALADPLMVRATVGGQDDEILLDARAVDAVQVAPMEQQFLLAGAEGPVEFAMVADSVVPVVLQLVGGGERLMDVSMVATGALAARQSRWDVVEVDGAADPIALSIAADSAAVEVEIDRALPVLESIEVVSGPDLWDPAQPIVLSSAGDAAICFTGVAAGRQIAGLTWDFDGAGLFQNDGCAWVNQFTSTLTVSAGGITRSFELDLVE